MGTMEVESALAGCPLVAEAAGVGRPAEAFGEAIGSIAKSKELRIGDAMAKTRSGKIVCRPLRSVANGEMLAQDLFTVQNPAVIAQCADSA
jgi:acetyl-CoA synthetase